MVATASRWPICASCWRGSGYGEVRTHLQSGNAVFTATGSAPEQLAQEIEGTLAGEVGLAVKVLVRTRAELERAITANPLLDVAEAITRDCSSRSCRTRPIVRSSPQLAPAEFEPDVFAVGEREIYAWYPDGVRATRLSNAFWERRLGVVATGRNWNTVTRLLELMDE